MKVFVATPTAGGLVKIEYTSTLMTVVKALTTLQAQWRYLNFDGADVVMARNFLTNVFLQDETCTHLLFIDSDMGVSYETVNRFLTADLPFLGAIYPKRSLNLATFYDGAQGGRSLEQSLALAQDFNVLLDPGQLDIKNGLCKVKALGFGFVLIQRWVFEALITQKIVQPLISGTLKTVGLTGDLYDFFSLIQLPQGDWLSEDYAFCDRAATLDGVDIWGWAGAGVSHIGSFAYGASYLDHLRAKNPPSTPA
ncbi:MAG TPA: hypothetical protein V6D02_05200 [Candidatus Obscuribacterales bacterium]